MDWEHLSKTDIFLQNRFRIWWSLITILFVFIFHKNWPNHIDWYVWSISESCTIIYIRKARGSNSWHSSVSTVRILWLLAYSPYIIYFVDVSKVINFFFFLFHPSSYFSVTRIYKHLLLTFQAQSLNVHYTEEMYYKARTLTGFVMVLMEIKKLRFQRIYGRLGFQVKS